MDGKSNGSTRHRDKGRESINLSLSLRSSLVSGWSKNQNLNLGICLTCKFIISSIMNKNNKVNLQPWNAVDQLFAWTILPPRDSRHYWQSSNGPMAEKSLADLCFVLFPNDRSV